VTDVVELQNAYDRPAPDPGDTRYAVAFRARGHRGTSLDGTFTKLHIVSISHAIRDYRAGERITGPLFLGKDTHALSAPAQRTALEFVAGNWVKIRIASATAGMLVRPAAGPPEACRGARPAPTLRGDENARGHYCGIEAGEKAHGRVAAAPARELLKGEVSSWKTLIKKVRNPRSEHER
jgi:hypothetical protein